MKKFLLSMCVMALVLPAFVETDSTATLSATANPNGEEITRFYDFERGVEVIVYLKNGVPKMVDIPLVKK